MAKFNWGFTEFSPTQASADYCCLPDVVLRAGKKGDKQWLYDKQADQTDAVIFSPREREREKEKEKENLTLILLHPWNRGGVFVRCGRGKYRFELNRWRKINR